MPGVRSPDPPILLYLPLRCLKHLPDGEWYGLATVEDVRTFYEQMEEKEEAWN